MARPRIGLALGSGSARGWSHIGIIEVLGEAGIEPDIVCGTSMGAFVGAACVAGKVGELKTYAEAVNLREMVRLLDVRLLGGGLIDGGQIVGFLRRLGVTHAIEDYPRPFAAIATDLMTGRELVIKSGPIDQAVRASISLPGIFKPCLVDDCWLADGGMVNPVPVSACRELGADIVIAVNLNDNRVGRRVRRRRAGEKSADDKPRNDILDKIREQMPASIRGPADRVAARLLGNGNAAPGYFEILTNSINIMQAQITESRLAVERPDILLVPDVREVGIMEFYRGREAIEAGRKCAADALPDILKLC
jgi:NTE family protein